MHVVFFWLLSFYNFTFEQNYKYASNLFCNSIFEKKKQTKIEIFASEKLKSTREPQNWLCLPQILCLLLEIDVYFHDVHKLSNFKYENGKHEECE